LNLQNGKTVEFHPVVGGSGVGKSTPVAFVAGI